jgi:hypothetical protein
LSSLIRDVCILKPNAVLAAAHPLYCRLPKRRVESATFPHTQWRGLREMTLLDTGWTEEQAQGLLDSLKLDGGTPEWKPEHLQRFRDWCSTHQKDASTIEAQLEFIADELLHSFQAVGIFLKRAQTVEEAKEAVRPYMRRLARQ